jgi:7-keto-8-aminopelargonate synthetase-like enzyme
MKRDMDLVRRILILHENADGKQSIASICNDGYSDEQIGHHTFLIGQHGLLATVESQGDGDPYPSAVALYVTWSGHDFLELARKPAIWETAKRKLADAGVGCTIELLKQALIATSKQALALALA